MPDLRRIIFVNRVYWPDEAATAQLLTDLAEGLAARGRDVHVIASGSDATARNGVTIRRTGASQGRRRLLARWQDDRRFLHVAQRELEALLEPGDTVVLKTDPPLLASRLAPVARARGAHVIHWIQDIYPEILPAHFGSWASPVCAWLRPARNRAWRMAKACVVAGPDMRGPVLAAGVSPEQIRVLSNWAPRELDTPARAEDVAALRRQWGLHEKFVIAYSGNLGRAHEFATLLDAARLLQRETEKVFVFIGSGPRAAEVRREATARGLTNVQFLPPAPRCDLAASLAAADVHAVTLRPGFERLVFPSKLAGILAAARPALFIGAPDTHLARLLRDEQCGGALAPGAAAELADLIHRLANDRVARATWGAAARAGYERHFRFPALLEAWDELLTSPGE